MNTDQKPDIDTHTTLSSRTSHADPSAFQITASGSDDTHNRPPHGIFRRIETSTVITERSVHEESDQRRQEVASGEGVETWGTATGPERDRDLEGRESEDGGCSVSGVVKGLKQTASYFVDSTNGIIRDKVKDVKERFNSRRHSGHSSSRTGGEQ